MNSSHVPTNDLYADVPLYGRYEPTEDDFRPDERHCNSYTPESLEYWQSVLERHCTAESCVYSDDYPDRGVFAVGTIIIKSDHLKKNNMRSYALRDANEVASINLASRVTTTPKILFAGKIADTDVLVETRIPGVALNVLWPHLDHDQRESFILEAYKCVLDLSKINRPVEVSKPGYIHPDPNPERNHGVSKEEYEILFTEDESSQLVFTHNDLQPSNIIINASEGRFAGIIDWERAGWFHLESVAVVHRKFRMIGGGEEVGDIDPYQERA